MTHSGVESLFIGLGRRFSTATTATTTATTATATTTTITTLRPQALAF